MKVKSTRTLDHLYLNKYWKPGKWSEIQKKIINKDLFFVFNQVFVNENLLPEV